MTTLLANQAINVPVYHHHDLVKTFVPMNAHDNFIKISHRTLIDDDIVSLKNENNMQGYLYKTGRNGKLQNRFFSITDDESSLSYYKSSNSNVPLATLHMAKTGEITMANEADPSGCTLSIEVLGRPYLIKANSPELCSEWIVELNRVKGKFTLHDTDDGGVDSSLSHSSATSTMVTPSRPRTRAVHGEEWFMLAEWEKKSLAFRMKQRFLLWARSMLGVGVEGKSSSTCSNLSDDDGVALTGALMKIQGELA